MKQVQMIVAGAGGRGNEYASYAKTHPDRLKIVGVAEPREYYRKKMADEYQIPRENVFKDWKQMAKRDRFADAVAICTQDRMHAKPAVAFADKKYHVLLEKPMAPNPADCRRIVEAMEKNQVLFAVCHVMRYTDYTQKLKSMLDSGLIGDIVSVEHLEPVGYWHQAHSFVRGSWRNEKESSFMLLAKSCHDIDWLRYIVGKPFRRVSSFGSLTHFRKECKPPAAGDALRCLDCATESTCPYSAKKIYIGRVQRGHTGWPVDVLSPDVSEAGIMQALREGPYGRCVYECDNDVVDHQVVNMEFEGGPTAVFTMTAFCRSAHRKTHIFGTKGHIYSDSEKIWHFDYLSDQEQVIDTVGAVTAGHGGGDYYLVDRFVQAIATGDASRILSGPRETLESHLAVFAAEKARRQGKVVEVIV